MPSASRINSVNAIRKRNHWSTRSRPRVCVSAAEAAPRQAERPTRGPHPGVRAAYPGERDRTERLIVVSGVTRQPEQGGPQLFTPLIHDLENSLLHKILSKCATKKERSQDV